MENSKALMRSRSTVRKFGGKIEDYLELHSWLDEPQQWIEGDKHLILRHHSQGIFEAEKKFGYAILNSNGKHVPTRTILEIHITEELGFIPTADEMLKCVDINKWMGFRNMDLNKKLKADNQITETTKIINKI